MSDVGTKGFFDRLAGSASQAVSRAPFFSFCALLVIVWVPSIAIIGDVDTWQLIINTATTIVTFLLVALLQNSQARFEAAINYKDDAIATGLRDLMQHIEHVLPCDEGSCDFRADIHALEQAVGIEEQVGTKGEV